MGFENGIFNPWNVYISHCLVDVLFLPLSLKKYPFKTRCYGKSWRLSYLVIAVQHHDHVSVRSNLVRYQHKPQWCQLCMLLNIAHTIVSLRISSTSLVLKHNPAQKTTSKITNTYHQCHVLLNLTLCRSRSSWPLERQHIPRQIVSSSCYVE